jgi:large subunit ribosomal protein L20
MRHKRHKKVVKSAEGYFQRKKNVFKNAHEQVMKSGQYAFRDRRQRKRDFRRLWIARISAACKLCDVRYSELIHGMTEKGMQVDRKALSELAIEDMKAFESLVRQATA